jgi:hypothetical protein
MEGTRMPDFTWEPHHTVSFLPTEDVKVNRRGEVVAVLMRVRHQRLLLTARPGALLVTLPQNLRLVKTRRQGVVKVTLSGRKEHRNPWWEGGVKVDEEYTRIESMTPVQCHQFLVRHLGDKEGNAAYDSLMG